MTIDAADGTNAATVVRIPADDPAWTDAMPSAPGSTEAARFLWPIDVARFLFALLVACGHAYGFARLSAPDWHVAWFDRVEPGGLWVAGFFVMSGWCIAAAERGRERFDLPRYVAARLSRILPLYVVFLGVTIVAEAAFAAVGGRPDGLWRVVPATLLAQLTMTQGLFGPLGAFNPSWSLTHEIVCYLAWGALVAGSAKRLSALAMMAIAIVPFVVTIAAHAVIHTETSWRMMSLPLYFFVWLLGAAAAESPGELADRRHRVAVALVAATFLAVLAAYALDRRVPETAGMLAFAVLLACAGLLLPRVGDAGAFEPLARRLGLASYPLYLGHGIVLVGTSVAAAHGLAPTAPVPFMGLTVTLSVVLAVVVGVPLERVTLAMRGRWLKRRFATA